MKIESVNVGMPVDVQWRGETVRTGIFKYPVSGPVMVRQHQVDGDGQADLTVHGGINKAVYVYAAEHYPYWNDYLQTEVETGAFGENITSSGLIDDNVCIGDEYQFGEAVLMAVQPRLPCGKLGVRFNDPRMTKYFFHARKNGIYFQVKREGMIKKGDEIILLKKSSCSVTIQDVVDNYVLREKDFVKIREITQIPFFPEWFRNEFIEMLG